MIYYFLTHQNVIMLFDGLYYLLRVKNK